MDERIFCFKAGKLIPQWDLMHRLSIAGRVSPEVRDSATVFRLNSTYMDVSDQPHMIRQWLSGGTLGACLMMAMCLFFAINVLYLHPSLVWDGIDTFLVSMMLSSAALFALWAIHMGKEEYFFLTRRPIRFNRHTKKLYAIRHRRYLDGHIVGDVVWEIPWDESVVFCVHKGPAKFDLEDHYHIRCYQLDDNGNVARAFAIGRGWEEPDGMRDLLAQWNYWCTYMNEGPEDLPQPLLYLAEYEDTFESFLYCLYEMGFGVSGAWRTVMLPFILMLTGLRLVSLWTCRQPVWPDEVLDVSLIARDDPYDQPDGDTPVGWGATVRARRDGLYPREPHRMVENWSGEPDAMANALLWLQDVAPATAPQCAQKSSPVT